MTMSDEDAVGAAEGGDDADVDDALGADNPAVQQAAAALLDKPPDEPDLNTLRGEYQNTWHMCRDLFQDKDLQKRLRLVVMGLPPWKQNFSLTVRSIQHSGAHTLDHVHHKGSCLVIISQ